MSADLIQTSPWPDALEELVERSRYRAHENWFVRLERDFSRDEVGNKVVGHGATLIITTSGFDAYHPELGRSYGVNHFFIVPAATYSRAAWSRWLLDRYIDVETHEACENYVLEYMVCGHCGKQDENAGDPLEDHSCTCPALDNSCGHSPDYILHERPFAPLHADGENPYVIHEYATDELKRTRPGGRVASE